MGNSYICMPKDSKVIASRNRKTGNERSSSSRRKKLKEEELLHKQALSMAIQQIQLSQRFDGSVSRRVGSTSSRRKNDLSDTFTTNQLADYLENIKTRKVVLIHGEGFGAWCWYKTIALLEETGLQPFALDLSGSGIHLTDTNNVTTLMDYSKPLIDFLQNISEDEKVILVGHSGGGACVSYAMEKFPEKISKAVFLCATMIANEQRPFDVFVEQLGSVEEFMKESKLLIHGNGSQKPPTGFRFEKHQMQTLYFNQSPAKDIALAMVSMRAIPLGPMMEKLSLTPEKYGTCRRFYIQTVEDHALSPDVQERLVRENPPEGVFKIKGSDHCPFFSKPQSLHKILQEISQIP